MRVRTWILTAGVSTMLLLPATGPAQFPPQGPGSGQPGGQSGERRFGIGGGQPGEGGRGFGGMPGGGGGFDPNRLFDMMARGKDVVNRADLDPMMQGMFDRFARNMNLPNGQMTRQQFTEYMQQRMAGGGRGGPGGGMQINIEGKPGGPGTFGGDPMANWADGMFRRYDQNGDGLLNYDEMPEALRAEREKWDTNKDGFIDLGEYKVYLQARIQQLQSERGAAMQGGQGSQQDDEEEQKPVVHRSGKLPKELPAWFAQMDTDGDAQVGLYEWKSSGRDLNEFMKMDRNGDGFLTVDEVLYYLAKNGGGESPGGFGGSPGFASSPGFGGFGGRPGGMFTMPVAPGSYGGDNGERVRGMNFPNMGGGNGGRFGAPGMGGPGNGGARFNGGNGGRGGQGGGGRDRGEGKGNGREKGNRGMREGR